MYIQAENGAVDQSTMEFDLTFHLLDNELLKIQTVSLAKLVIRRGFLSRTRIAKSDCDFNVINEGKRVDFTGDGLVLSERLSRIRLKMRLAKEVTSPKDTILCALALQLNTGLVLRLRIRLAGGEATVSSPFLSNVRTVFGLIAIGTTSYLLIEWSSNELDVYRQVQVSRTTLAAIAAALIAYLGFPRLENLASSVTRDFFDRFRSYVLYPEFYFDAYLVMLLRNWLSVALIVGAGILVFDLSRSYQVIPLDRDELGDEYRLISVRNTYNPAKPRECVDGSRGLAVARSEFFGSIIQEWRAFDLQRETTRTSIPDAIYRKDIGSTCVSFRSYGEGEVRPFCVATLQQSGDRAVPVFRSFRSLASGSRFSFQTLDLEGIDSPDTRSDFLAMDEPSRFALVLQNRVSDWTFRSFFDDDCEVSVAQLVSVGPDLSEFAEQVNQRLDEIDQDDHIPPFGVERVLNRSSRRNYLQSELDEMVDQIRRRLGDALPVDDNMVATFDDGFQPGEFFEILLLHYRAEESVLDMDTVDLDLRDRGRSSDVPRLLGLSYLPQYRNTLIRPIARLWLGMRAFDDTMREYNARLDREDYVYDESELRAAVEAELIPLFEAYSECDDFDLRVGDTYCTSARHVVADVMLFVLLLEKQYLRDSTFHEVIVDHLVHDDTQDYFNYLMLAFALELLDNDRERQDYFNELYRTLDTNRYGCAAEYTASRVRGFEARPIRRFRCPRFD